MKNNQLEYCIENNKIYVIAEIGINHNGRIDTAKKLIKAAVDAGADAVKFQLRNLKEVYTNQVFRDSKKSEQGSQYILSELRKSNLTKHDIKDLYNFSKKFNVDFIVTPFDPNSATFLNKLGIQIFKVGSPDLTNLILLKQIADFNKPMIVSTGMSEYDEIKKIVSFLKDHNAKFLLLHCNSTYPAFPQDLNLSFILKMKADFDVPVGYSGHERGYLPSLAAVALGAKIIERHITFDTDSEGPDHSSSLTSLEFSKMIKAIREIEISIGRPERHMSQGERGNRLSLGKSLVYNKTLKIGTILNQNHFAAKSPAKGLSCLEIENFIGKRLLFSVKKDQYLENSHIKNEPKIKPLKYRAFSRWGNIGRLNDFENFLTSNPKIIEIHLTWRDLVESNRPIRQIFDQELTIHAPEYYEDKLVDFTTNEEDITKYSKKMLHQTIELAKKITNKFRGTEKNGPIVIVHPGGHSKEPQKNIDVKPRYDNLIKNLKTIDTSEVQLLIENQAPLPWYFGGQWYQNIFMNALEIENFFKETKLKMCYDVSHAQLYCNLTGKSLIEHAKMLAPYTKYLHISDAKGFAEEGLQIGEGEVDFKNFFEIYKGKNLGFVPEIWQGHLNNGEGFKIALNRLEKILSQR